MDGWTGISQHSILDNPPGIFDEFVKRNANQRDRKVGYIRRLGDYYQMGY